MKLPDFTHTPLDDHPLASPPFTSYRLRGPYGWIHIGAMDAVDAMCQAARSTRSPDPAALEVWNGTRYVPVPVNALRRMPR